MDAARDADLDVSPVAAPAAGTAAVTKTAALKKGREAPHEDLTNKKQKLKL